MFSAQRGVVIITENRVRDVVRADYPRLATHDFERDIYVQAEFRLDQCRVAFVEELDEAPADRNVFLKSILKETRMQLPARVQQA